MASSFAKIEAEALQLSSEERVLFADHLLSSISSDQDICGAWAEAVERRLAEVEAGAPLVSPEDAVARARPAIS